MSQTSYNMSAIIQNRSVGNKNVKKYKFIQCLIIPSSILKKYVLVRITLISRPDLIIFKRQKVLNSYLIFFFVFHKGITLHSTLLSSLNNKTKTKLSLNANLSSFCSSFLQKW